MSIVSATKYYSGHSDVMGGSLAVNKKVFNRVKATEKITGLRLGPDDAYLITRGLRTLDVRLDRHRENAKKVADFLSKKGKTVLYAIHPVAGRMPGHMNVLLAEANIPYDQLKDLDEVNNEFEDCDVALVLGANDVVNPAARHDSSSPIYGMPILDVDKSQTVIINKRTMNTGFAGVQNELFGYDNSIMVFGDAKDMLQQLLKDLKEL